MRPKAGLLRPQQNQRAGALGKARLSRRHRKTTQDFQLMRRQTRPRSARSEVIRIHG